MSLALHGRGNGPEIQEGRSDGVPAIDLAKRLDCAVFRRFRSPREHQSVARAPEYGARQALRDSSRPRVPAALAASLLDARVPPVLHPAFCN